MSNAIVRLFFPILYPATPEVMCHWPNELPRNALCETRTGGGGWIDSRLLLQIADCTRQNKQNAIRSAWRHAFISRRAGSAKQICLSSDPSAIGAEVLGWDSPHSSAMCTLTLFASLALNLLIPCLQDLFTPGHSLSKHPVQHVGRPASIAG